MRCHVDSVPFHLAASTNNTFGQQSYVISSRRDSYLVSSVNTFGVDLADAKRTLMLGNPYQVHGSGSFIAAPLVRRVMQTLQSRARVPILMSYREVGSLEAQVCIAPSGPCESNLVWYRWHRSQASSLAYGLGVSSAVCVYRPSSLPTLTCTRPTTTSRCRTCR
jgi:hypothetical protein